MPLSLISARTSALGAFTFRELLAQRRMAQKALRRGRPAAAVLDKIDAELLTRREAKFLRAGRPELDG